MNIAQKITVLCTTALALVFTSSFSFADTVKKAEKKVEEETVVIKELDTKTFDKELKDSKLPVVVDFTAWWCGPCQRLKPKLDQLAQEFKGKVIFVKVEITQSPKIASDNGVSSYPTVKLFAPGGKSLSTSVGDKRIEDLRKWLQDEVDAYNKSLTKPQGTNGGNNP